jgi:hypothetical protein
MARTERIAAIVGAGAPPRPNGALLAYPELCGCRRALLNFLEIYVAGTMADPAALALITTEHQDGAAGVAIATVENLKAA